MATRLRGAVTLGAYSQVRRSLGPIAIERNHLPRVVFMIMASQFKSLRLPFIMLFTIPVSLLGIVLASIAGGQGFSITALMGVLMVVGIAVSNGILLIDDANRRFNEGADKVEAVVAAARTRFVPLAMTSLATVLLVPVMFLPIARRPAETKAPALVPLHSR